MTTSLVNAPTQPPSEPPVETITCWSEVGVYGNSSCARLNDFVHCRNCPVYSAAALQLLERPMPEDYRREWTRHFAAEDTPVAPVRASALLFRLENEWLGLPTHAFQEVAERRLIHSLPHRRSGLALGLVNIRGEILVCVSLARLLGLPPSQRDEARDYDRLLVVSWQGQRLVFPADEVHGIERFQIRELRPPPATVAKSAQTFAQGILLWQQRAVGYLDAAALFAALDRSLS